MSDYSQITDFSAKDSLPTGDSEKVILGSDVDAELAAISTAIASKVDEPSSPSTNDVLTWNGSAVVWGSPVGAIPAGVMAPFAGPLANAPSGWLPCDGRSLATASYPDLFSALGYAWGGSGSSFNLPDLRFRVPVGADDMGTAAGAAGRDTGATISSGDADTVGSAGGEAAHTLTTAELASHSHGAGTYAGPAHTHGLPVADNNDTSGTATTAMGSVDAADRTLSNATASGGGGSVTGTSASAGSGDAHNTMQPFGIVLWVIKT